VVKRVCFLVVSGLILGYLTSCDSSSGSTDFIGGADFSLSVSPSQIDTGDRTQVKLELNEIHPDGIIIKIRFPSELSYVEGSTELEVAEEEIELAPNFLVTDENDDWYLVFFLDEDLFGFEEEGVLTLELRAVDELEGGEIELDVDIRDTDSFDVNQPEFSPEDSDFIEVGSST